MSEASIFQPPDREPLFTRCVATFNPASQFSVGVETSYWPATHDQLGQERHRQITHTFYETPSGTSNLKRVELRMERVAREGMRPVFETAGIYTSVTTTEVEDQYHMPVRVEESVFVFGGVHRLVKGAEELTSGGPEGTRFSLLATLPEHFSCIDQVLAIEKLQILIASEEPNPTDHATVFRHDLRIHHAALYCLPPVATAGIFTVCREAAAMYYEAMAMDDSHPFKEQRLHNAIGFMQEISDTLELVAISNIEYILDGKPEGLTPTLAKLLNLTPYALRTEIAQHVRNPQPENILVARFI